MQKNLVHTGKTVSVSTPQLTNDYLFVSHGWTVRPKNICLEGEKPIFGLKMILRALVGFLSHFPTAQLSKLSLRNCLGYYIVNSLEFLFTQSTDVSLEP